MLKYALLAGVMTFAAPVMAQAQTNTSPQSTTAPTQAQVPQSVPHGAPVADAQPASPTPMDSATAPATDTAAAQPAAGAGQVASVVDTEFPTYDANKDGKLERAEFASWMVKLKQASDPKASATSAATKSWVSAAFAQADKDKSQSITKPELVGFLSQGQS